MCVLYSNSLKTREKGEDKHLDGIGMFLINIFFLHIRVNDSIEAYSILRTQSNCKSGTLWLPKK